MLVSVTEKHCTLGKVADSYCCPIALALIDAGFERPNVAVFDGERSLSVWVTVNGERKFTQVYDSAAAAKLRSYDRTEKMDPFQFEFEVK